MLKALDHGGRHHHMATKANEAPSLKTRHPFGWSAPCMSDITPTQPTRHTKHVRELWKPTHQQPSHPKCIPKTWKHAPNAYQHIPKWWQLPLLGAMGIIIRNFLNKNDINPVAPNLQSKQQWNVKWQSKWQSTSGNRHHFKVDLDTINSSGTTIITKFKSRL